MFKFETDFCCVATITGKYNEAITEHEEELSLSEALEDKIGCAVACRKIGECYCGQEKYEQALKLQQRHLTLAKSCDNLLEEQRAWATIGRTYLFQIETSKGKDVTETSTKQAKDAFFKSLEVCEKLRSSVKNVDYMEMKARLYLNLGMILQVWFGKYFRITNIYPIRSSYKYICVQFLRWIW